MAPGGPPALTRSTMVRATACPQRKAPLRLTRMTRSKSASARSRKSTAARIRRIVDEDVDVAEGSPGARDQIGHVGAVADVAADETDRAAEPRHGLGAGLLVDIGDDHACALIEEAAGDGMADAPRCSGDDRDLVFEHLHRGLPLRRSGISTTTNARRKWKAELAMRAVGYQAFPADRSECRSLIDIERDLPEPKPAGRDLLVRVEAVSVNPVDTKVRKNDAPGDGFRVLGFDAVGTVEAVGEGVTLFKTGDRVWYAGSILRSGSNAELHLVDERIVGHLHVDFRRRCGRATSDCAHRLGDAVRPLRRYPAGADWQSHAPRHRRGRGRGVDRDPDRKARRRHAGDRERITARNGRSGPDRWVPTSSSTTASRWRPR